MLVNKAMEESIGFRQEEFVGKSDYELSPLDLAEACRKSDSEALKAGGPSRSDESYTDKKGELRFLDVVKSPIYDTKGYLRGRSGSPATSPNVSWSRRPCGRARKNSGHFFNLLSMHSLSSIWTVISSTSTRPPMSVSATRRLKCSQCTYPN